MTHIIYKCIFLFQCRYYLNQREVDYELSPAEPQKVSLSVILKLHIQTLKTTKVSPFIFITGNYKLLSNYSSCNIFSVVPNAPVFTCFIRIWRTISDNLVITQDVFIHCLVSFQFCSVKILLKKEEKKHHSGSMTHHEFCHACLNTDAILSCDQRLTPCFYGNRYRQF